MKKKLLPLLWWIEDRLDSINPKLGDWFYKKIIKEVRLMDALVEVALQKVNEEVKKATDDYYSARVRKNQISKAVNAVDALKSALKAL